MFRSNHLLLALAVIPLACGGKVVAEAAGSTGGGGAASSGNISSVGNTTSGGNQVSSGATTGPCACSSDFDCPVVDDGCSGFSCQQCQCVEVPLPAGSACLGGVCDGGFGCVECLSDQNCPGSDSCVDQQCVGGIPAICAELCPLLEACTGTSTCLQGCSEDLADCSAAQLDDVASCTQLLGADCDVDAWLSCMQPIGCIDI
jgi:hypothetical protein